MLPYQNRDLENMDGEEWVDAYGYDGIYSVSNLGRVRSEQREVWNGRGLRMTKTKILSQGNGVNCSLSIRLKTTPHTVGYIVFISFYPDKIPKQDECVMHINKNIFDNRIENLMTAKISISHKINYLYDLLPHLEKNNNKKHINFEKEYTNLKVKTCNFCHKVKSKECFEKNRYICRKCRNKRRLDKYYATRNILKNNNHVNKF